MSGYTLNGVAGRIRDLENKTNGAYYVALCWLAMNRNSGKGAKKLLEGKIFGQGKPTSTFRNAWRIADKSFAEGFYASHRQSVAELALDDAIDFAVNALEAHKTALGVTSMGAYEDVCKYATKDDIPSEAENEAEGETTAETEIVDDGKVETPLEERNTMDIAVRAMEALNSDELMEFAALVQARIVSLNDDEQFQMAA